MLPGARPVLGFVPPAVPSRRVRQEEHARTGRVRPRRAERPVGEVERGRDAPPAEEEPGRVLGEEPLGRGACSRPVPTLGPLLDQVPAVQGEPGLLGEPSQVCQEPSGAPAEGILLVGPVRLLSDDQEPRDGNLADVAESERPFERLLRVVLVEEERAAAVDAACAPPGRAVSRAGAVMVLPCLPRSNRSPGCPVCSPMHVM